MLRTRLHCVSCISLEGSVCEGLTMQVGKFYRGFKRRGFVLSSKSSEA